MLDMKVKKKLLLTHLVSEYVKQCKKVPKLRYFLRKIGNFGYLVQFSEPRHVTIFLVAQECLLKDAFTLASKTLANKRGE